MIGRMPPSRPRCALFAVPVAVAILVSMAHAAPAKKPAPRFEELRKELRSTEPATIARALTAVEKLGKEAAPLAPDVEALLRRGLTKDLALAAIHTLGGVAQPSSSKVLGPWARHRAAELRLAAVTALGDTGGPASVAPLRKALSDKEKPIRSAAATSLGRTGGRDAMTDLEAALDKELPEASWALGRLCEDRECEALAARLAKQPFALVARGLEQAIVRAGGSDELKERLIARVRDVGTDEARQFLAGLAARYSGSARVKAALEAASKAPSGDGRRGGP